MINRHDIEWTIECLPESLDYVGNCSAVDDETDAKAEQWIAEQLAAGNEWAWCCIKVTGWYEGLYASDYLGGCSYVSQDDFEKGGYYEDMQTAVIEELERILHALLSRHCDYPVISNT